MDLEMDLETRRLIESSSSSSSSSTGAELRTQSQNLRYRI